MPWLEAWRGRNVLDATKTPAVPLRSGPTLDTMTEPICYGIAELDSNGTPIKISPIPRRQGLAPRNQILDDPRPTSRVEIRRPADHAGDRRPYQFDRWQQPRSPRDRTGLRRATPEHASTPHPVNLRVFDRNTVSIAFHEQKKIVTLQPSP